MTGPAPRAGRAQRVLVVDDDPIGRIALLELLEMEGIGADAVGDGRQALSWLSDHRPETGLVLLDLMMPIMDGDTFLFAKERDRTIADVPVVLMTASGRDACDQMARHHRIWFFMHKPVTIPSLLHALTYCTGQKSPGI